MEILALIPARSGSQRIPGKNIKLLSGLPLIAYSIQAARRSKYINRIVVSTDSPRICRVAKEFGAQVPFIRPKRISGSYSTEMDFFIHTLNWLKLNEGYCPDLIVLLYPTSPFRKAASIDRAIELMKRHPKADSLRSVRLCREHPYKMWIKKGNYLKPLVEVKDTSIHTWSYQSLPKVYLQNANIYITKPRTILKKHSPIGDSVLTFIMEERESLDINTLDDFLLAEKIMKQKKKIK